MTTVKMALSAELKLRDKHTQRICVQVENDLSSLNDGIKELNVNVSQLLSELVEREKAQGACAAGQLPDANTTELTIRS